MMKVFFIVIVSVLGGACNNKGKQVNIRANENDSTDKLAVYTSENGEMNFAIDQARKSFPDFLVVLQDKCEDCERFNVKIRLGFGDNDGEHVWLDSLFLKNSKLYGVLASVPEKVTRVNFGDILEANKDSLSDWMYIQKGKLAGGFTIKVIYDQLPVLEKKQMEEEFGAMIR